MFFLQMAGFPGSGKSTLARRVAKITGAVVIDHDVVKSALLESWEGSIDTRVAGKVSYSIEWALVDSLLSEGHSVVLDSPCVYAQMLEKGLNLSKKHGVKYKYVECYLNDLNEINKRLTTRKKMPSQIQQVLANDPFELWVNNSKRPSDIRYLVVDSVQPVEDYLDEVMSYLTC